MDLSQAKHAFVIEQDAPYGVTHKGVWPAIEQRMQATGAACDYRREH
jgi:hypothetical protein